MPDIFQSVDNIEVEKQTMVVERLELRAATPEFVAMRNGYFEAIDLPSAQRVLEIGCGTGAVCRAIATWPGFEGEVTGTDLSQSLIDAAGELTRASGIDGITYLQADGQGSSVHQGEFDIVLGHTVASHVADPDAFLAEALRLVRPGGKIVLHDADYASLTLDTGAPIYDTTLPAKLCDAIVANPFVMRELPRRLNQLGLKSFHSIGVVLLETGTGEYFPNFIRSWLKVAASVGAMTDEEASGWVAALDKALESQSYFGSCNFLTYVIPIEN